MKIPANSPVSAEVELVDVTDRVIPYVTEYDTETKEATIFIRGDEGLIMTEKEDGSYEIAKAVVKLPGSRLVYKGTKEPFDEKIHQKD